MARIEYKYFVPPATVERLREDLAPFVRHDKYCSTRKNRQYTVRSIYFDTTQLDFYQQKISGVRDRQKIRIRTYNEVTEDNPVFLEIKRKRGSALQKIRSRVKFENIEKLFLTQDIDQYIMDTGEVRNANMFFFQIQRLNLQQVINVIYEREAFFYRPYSGMRITIDKNLRAIAAGRLNEIYKERNSVYPLAGNAILEVKLYGGLPYWVRKIISSHNLKLRAISKYTNALDAVARHDSRLKRVLHMPKSLRVTHTVPRLEKI